MQVLLIQADGSYPNLALMKLSAYYKSLGDEVFLERGLNGNHQLLCPNPDLVAISCIFSWNKTAALELAGKFESEVKTYLGGYGINDHKLVPEIERLCPDYSLYGINYSMGFTSRGCIRRCPWCAVWKNEGNLMPVAPIGQFHDLRHEKIILFDNNFLASPKWYEETCYLVEHRLDINFFQGLDIRLVDSEIANVLAGVNYYDSKFRNRTLHFAFDSMEVENDVLEGIRTLEKVGIPRKHLTFYVLVGFNTTYEEDLHRVHLLIKEKVKPYIMPYNNRHDSFYPHLERWINGRFYHITSWEKYDHGNSQEVIRQVMNVS